MTRDVWMYWTGNKPDLIQKLFDKIIRNSEGGRKYVVHALTDDNIKEYLQLPEYFYRLKPAHKADYVRVKVIRKYGGIWLDADTLVLKDLSGLFQYLENDRKGFFVIEDNISLCNGVFGSLPNTELMVEWERRMEEVLKKKAKIYKEGLIQLNWIEIGTNILSDLGKQNIDLYNGFKIIDGTKRNFRLFVKTAEKFFDKKQDQLYNEIIKKDDIVILTNVVYKMWEILKDKPFLNETLLGKLLNYEYRKK